MQRTGSLGLLSKLIAKSTLRLDMVWIMALRLHLHMCLGMVGLSEVLLFILFYFLDQVSLFGCLFVICFGYICNRSKHIAFIIQWLDVSLLCNVWWRLCDFNLAYFFLNLRGLRWHHQLMRFLNKHSPLPTSVHKRGLRPLRRESFWLIVWNVFI